MGRVPFCLLQDYREVHPNLIHALEKKFSGTDVVLVGNRQLKFSRKHGMQVKLRRGSFKYSSIHEAILSDLVYPSDIVGKRTQYHADGSKMHRVYIDSKDRAFTMTKLDI